MSAVGTADLEARLADLEAFDQQYGLSPEGRKKRDEIQKALMQAFVEQQTQKDAAAAALQAATEALQPAKASLLAELEIFTGIAADYVAARAAYDLAASTARKRDVSFEPVSRLSEDAPRNSEESYALRNMLDAFHGTLRTRW